MQCKNHRGIYFNNVLTARNRALIVKATLVAKHKNFKLYLGGSRIFMRKFDAIVKVIECDADIDTVKLWEPNEKITLIHLAVTQHSNYTHLKYKLILNSLKKYQ
jgi:hypothetical protein